MRMQILPVFKDIFPEEEQPTLKEVIKGIPTDLIIKCCCYINAQLYFAKDRLKIEQKIFVHLIERIEDHKLRNAPFLAWQEFQRKLDGHNIAIFALPHTLELIQEAYLADYIPFRKSTPDEDLRILKALLILNSTANQKTVTIFKRIDLSNEENIYRVYWSSLLQNSTVLQKKDFILSIYKSLKFLSFLKSKYEKYLNEYLKLYDVNTYHQIPLRLFFLYSNGYEKNGDFSYSFFKKELLDHFPFVADLTLNVKTSSREEYKQKKFDMNFKGSRTYPFLELTGNQYHLNNWSFIIEKFYEGIVFDFYAKTSIKEIKELKTFEDYKGKMGDYFSNNFFMNLMKEIFDGNVNACYREKERNEKCDYDFYIRQDHHVFIFEFKDILFPLKETYEEIKQAVHNKLVENKKGIKQLVRQLRNFHMDTELYDDLKENGINAKDLIVHPVLVYTDSAYGMTGINHYLNKRFLSELNSEGKFDFKVLPLTTISLDFFLEEFAKFKRREIDLIKITEIYFTRLEGNIKQYEKERNAENLQDAYSGFDTIIRQELPAYSADQLKSPLYEWVLSELKPFLADG